MEWQLENKFLRVRIDSRGAEIKSLYDKNGEREYFWQGASEIWSGHSMLLFPAAGRISRNRVLIDGREYPMAMHGFLKDMEFSCRESHRTELTLTVRDTEETFRSYPCHFTVQVKLLLEEKMLVQNICILNQNDGEMYFAFGAHPGFFCPIVLGEAAEDYALWFDRPQTVYRLELEHGTRLCTGRRELWLNGEKRIPLREDFFDRGPVLSEGYDADWIELRSEKSGTALRMGIKGFPYMTFWGNPHSMSLICMEPWCGISDFADTDHIWRHKKGNVCLAPQQSFVRSITFCPIAGESSR